MNGKCSTALWTRRQVVQAGAAAGLGGALMPPLHSAQPRTDRPNIIWIMADDLGYADTSFTGQRNFATPNIDRIAQQGLFLRQSYANSAVCSATRTGLITGRYQYRLRVGLEEPIGSASDTIGLDPDHPTLPSLLRDHGYRTSLVGKWHLGFSERFGPLQSGYQSFYGVHFGAADYFRHRSGDPVGANGQLYDGNDPDDENGYLTALFTRRAVREIHAGKEDARPFFLSLHYTSPHWPWEGPEDEAIAATLGNNLQHRDGGNLATYKRMVLEMDVGVGQVLKALDGIGATRNTIVIFTSDNGGERFSDTWPFIGQKGELLEGGIRVPLFVRWPARIKAGQSSEQVNISMDWVPTLLAAAGATTHPDYPSDGMNLLDVVTGRASTLSRQLFWRYNSSTQSALRDGDWKYLKIKNNEYLFNLAEDERERANLSRREAARFAAMQATWAAWNATMLPYPEGSVAYGNTGADRY
jgi:arylsulfatase A-like enzyme